MGKDERRGCSDSNHQPDNARDSKTGERGNLQQDGMPRIEVTDGAPGEQEHDGRDAGERDQADIDGAMQALLAVAVQAGSEMVFIVTAHLRSDAGNVVTPAGEDVADHGVCAMQAHAGSSLLSAKA